MDQNLDPHPFANAIGISPRVVENFLTRIQRGSAEDDCWIWTGSTNIRGYPQYCWRGRPSPSLAHRLCYELCFGFIPQGYQVHHKCRVRLCVNPRHLKALSPGEHTTIHKVPRKYCRRGHELTDNNLIKDSRGRSCKICSNERGILPPRIKKP